MTIRRWILSATLLLLPVPAFADFQYQQDKDAFFIPPTTNRKFSPDCLTLAIRIYGVLPIYLTRKTLAR